MSRGLKILIIIGLIVLLIWVGIRIFSAFFLGPRAPRPAITRGEFNFRLVYEIDGERFIAEDTLIVEHGGTGWDAGAGHFNKWTSHFESGNDGVIELFRDESERIFIDVPRYLIPRYLMGERYLSPTRNLIRRVSLNDSTIPSSRLTLLEDELLNEYGIEIIIWEHDPPIENRFE
ncbi:MAG: hypothetical protein FWG67_05130 [Defluviitaleaceae bacterium]|nr:hypothetical protein [Defluviitaleaceae bacterium]